MTTSSKDKAKPGTPKAQPKQAIKPLDGLRIAKAINPPQLLNELGNLGVKGLVQRLTPESFVLQVKTRPGHVTDAQIQSVVAAHKPAADPVVEKLHRWASLSAADKDALLLAVAKKVYGVR